MGYRRFQIGFVFVEYDLLIQKSIYMNFRINFTKFHINFSRQEHQIDISGFILYPLSFFLYSPFNSDNCLISGRIAQVTLIREILDGK